MSLTNKKLSGYLIKESIGEGAFGTVNRSIHFKTANTVALKIVKREVVCSVADNGSNQFQNELTIWEKLSHPHVISLIHVFQTFHEFGIVTEYAPLGDLKKLIRSGDYISSEQSALLFTQVALAIAYLHQRDLCHRDIKADNVLMFSKNFCKLCDFGFCTESRKDKQQTKFCGTLTYLAPEILRTYNEITGKCSYDGKQTDIWSLGVLLYLMISKKLPFTGHSESMIETNIMNGYYSEIEVALPNVNILMKGLLCNDPLMRYTSEDVLKSNWLKKTIQWPLLVKKENNLLELNMIKAKKHLRETEHMIDEVRNENNLRSEEGAVLRLITTKLLNDQLIELINDFVLENFKEEQIPKKKKDDKSVFKRLKKRLSRKSY
ncbi:Serine/threonine-protein kinase NIM1-like [Oopsacas minuta]|uniref:Serine/threonine-protein kinase NIM1-like n=1 Tax=Oopsacas minuta TaxID=111878 RepID=A0AAV7JMD2_9METZ|nr:Serine/threonine-protein kinase NIM1-like [Oopsacas minuta]